jgi:membrane protein insertase Oxa1/YidC/SpoIIIJ
MSVLDWLHGWVGSWGLAILALAVVVRILIFPIAQVALKKNAKMVTDQSKLKPLIKEAQARHKGDLVETHEASMASIPILLLYWITSNLLQFLQQRHVSQAIAREAPGSA